MKDNFAEIEKTICYSFKNIELLMRAFTHSSYGNGKSYQNLEFLGDSIVNFVIAKKLFDTYGDHSEGYLTKLRSQIVSEKPLAEAMDRLGISKYLLVGVGEKRQNISSLPSVKSDLYESIVGAVFLDAGIDVVEDYIFRTLDKEIADAGKPQKRQDFKSRLNEYSLKHSFEHTYEQLSGEGPAHDPMFTFTVKVNGEQMGEGKGKTKKEAQQSAAKSALEALKEKNRKTAK